ncbi:MAG: family efflux transporter [Devosia sp.]|uniref:MATE family efflux transporter n=1 Tax=Devosia sp. TaxID=1871048 RepID=UPI0026280F9C|nr:MATE family efflux transporter [Devosia sp.]MDB5527741.1 family efflux transporter [Devosia sp.]
MTNDTTAARHAAAERVSQSAGWTTELRAMFTLAWPLVIAQLAQNALTTTDVIMIGWLGPRYLAAATLATTFLMPALLTAMGIVGAVAPLVAQARGSRDIKAVRRIVRQGAWAAIALAALLTPIIWQIKPIFLALGQDPDTTELAEQFIHIGVWMLFPALLIAVLRSMLSAFDATRVILLITVAGVFVNAGINYLLIFGNFGFPRLELRGAAISTLSTNIVMFALTLAYVLRHRRFKRFHVLLRFWRPDWSRFREIFRIGLPIGLTVLAEISLFTAAALLMGRLGTDEIAAHAIALQCASMAFMVPLGIGTAATVRVGMAYGRSDPSGVARAGWTAIVLGVGFMALSCLLFLTLAPSVVGLFLNSGDPANTNALALAASFLVIAGVFQLVDGGQVVAAHALRGLSDTTVPMILAIAGYWVIGLPVAYVLGFVVQWRGVGIWIGLASGLAFVAVVLVARFAMRERLGLMRPR